MRTSLLRRSDPVLLHFQSMRFILRVSSAFLFVTALVTAPLVHAQDPSPINLARLTQLYRQYSAEAEKLSPNAESLKRIVANITTERVEIRSLIEKELLALTNPDETVAADSPRRSLTRQRSSLNQLQDRLREHEVDLQFLIKEEELYALGQHTESGAKIAGIILATESEPELLAKKAEIEERLDVLARLITTQSERVQQLNNAERDRQIGVALSFLSFLGAIFGVLWVERLIRIHLFLHIPNRAVRYTITKLFMTAIYAGLIFWIIQGVIAEYPNILTAVAFIGAALIVVLQDIIRGFVGWLTQVQLLTLGNRVTIGTPDGPVTGDVVDVGMLYVSLLVVRTPELTSIAQVGKVIRVPNSYLLSQPIINYNSTSDFIRVEMPVRLRDVTQTAKAKQMFETILKEKTDKYFEAAHRQIDQRTRKFFFPPEFHLSTVFLELKNDGVHFILCFMTPLRKRRVLITEITEAILEYCGKAGIRIEFSKGEEE